jgi:threonine/homoserine/homoserine lactone efflux protein
MLQVDVVGGVALRNVIVGVGILVVLAYLVLSYPRSFAVLAIVGALAAVYFGQQLAFTSVVLPELERTLSESALDSARRVQAAFEIGFVIKVAIIGIELIVEKVFTGDEPLRTFSDGLLSAVSVVIILVIIAALSAFAPVDEVVFSVLSAVLALRIVQTGVDFSIAAAQRSRGGAASGAATPDEA